MLFHVDNVDNFVHNFNFQYFSDVHNVEKMCMIFSTFPPVYAVFVQFVKSTFLSCRLRILEKMLSVRLPDSLEISAQISPRLPRLKQPSQPDAKPWYGCPLLQKLPVSV